MASQWWFANEIIQDDFTGLVPTSTNGSDNYSFHDAEKLSITVDTVFVRERKDHLFRKSNDLIICTKHQRGDRPHVDKVHFYKQNEEAPKHEGAFFHPVVFATRDFREDDAQFTIEMRVYDEDGLNRKEAGAIEAGIESVASASAIAFPAFAPHSGLASGAGSALMRLVDTLDQHDRILDGRIVLSVNKPPHQGYDLLQPGFLVCFALDVDASSLGLGNDRRVYRRIDHQKTPYLDMSYAVLRMRRDFVPTPDYIVDEKAATLLAQLDSGKGQIGSSTLTFLRETLDAYTTFRRLQRYTELADKPALSEAEKGLLGELKSDPKLSPYLPSGQPQILELPKVETGHVPLAGPMPS